MNHVNVKESEAKPWLVESEDWVPGKAGIEFYTQREAPSLSLPLHSQRGSVTKWAQILDMSWAIWLCVLPLPPTPPLGFSWCSIYITSLQIEELTPVAYSGFLMVNVLQGRCMLKDLAFWLSPIHSNHCVTWRQPESSRSWSGPTMTEVTSSSGLQEWREYLNNVSHTVF